MIDAHVHLRDWEQAASETLAHGLGVAVAAGLDGVFEMPNTRPLILDAAGAGRRIEDADRTGVRIFHGLYVGLTADRDQIGEALKAYATYFPRVVGFKLFAGRSTGELSVVEKAGQKIVFEELARRKYRGVLAVHAEKEERFRPELWDEGKPASHSEARPEEAETESVQDMLDLAAGSGYEGVLHIAHISVPESVRVLRRSGGMRGLRVSCGVTPHHLFMGAEDMKGEDALLMKVNPPVRAGHLAAELRSMLREGLIDWIETDHAPHTMMDKKEKFASGMPGLAVWPYLPDMLSGIGISREKQEDLLHGNVEKMFGIEIHREGKRGRRGLFSEYATDPWARQLESHPDPVR